jgi:caffeoyl-CoA O-methyltransferase
MAEELISPKAEKYVAQYTTPEEPIATLVNEFTAENHPEAHMLSGHVQGRFLAFVSKMLQPKNILEIGTFTGYSALCLSEGLAEDGELHTIELREEDADTALGFFKQAGKEKQVILHRGNAKDIIPTLPNKWDLVFIDADKTGYVDYYELVVPRLTEKGVILADNVLFHGQVLEEPVRGKSAIAIDNFNKHVANDHRVEQVMLTLRDGLLLIKKK